MADQSILDQAAEVREKARKVKDLCNDLRRSDREWVGLEIASEEAVEIARSGLRHAWTMLDRISQLANLEMQRPLPSSGEGGSNG